MQIVFTGTLFKRIRDDRVGKALPSIVTEGCVVVE